MAEHTQTFSISADIPSGKCNTSSLEETILDDPNIETALKHCVTSGDELHIVWKAPPSPQTVTALTNNTTGPCGGILGAHDGSPPAEAPVDERGAPIVVPTFADARGHDPEWKGYKYVATPAGPEPAPPRLSVWDQLITVEREIRSGNYRIIPPGSGTVPTDDVIEFSVVDKDDVLGHFGDLGFTVGEDFIELKKWVRNEHVDGNIRNERRFEGEEVFKIVPGLYLRTAYTSTAEDVPEILVTVKDYSE